MFIRGAYINFAKDTLQEEENSNFEWEIPNSKVLITRRRENISIVTFFYCNILFIV